MLSEISVGGRNIIEASATFSLEFRGKKLVVIHSLVFGPSIATIIIQFLFMINKKSQSN